MPPEMKSPCKFGGGALVASGVLFAVLAFLDFRTGPPPSNGAEILLWRDSQALVLDFVSEFLFFATVLLVPGTVALYQSLADVDRTKAATGCGIIAATIPVMAVILIVHGRLVYPIVLSLAMKRGVYAKWIAYFGFAAAALDIFGSYPWAIGPVLTLVCELSFAGWFVAVGSQLFRMRSAA